LEIVDRTSFTVAHSVNRAGKAILDAPPVRAIGRVDTVMLHQTDYRGSTFGNDVTAYDPTIAHFVVTPNGTALQLHRLDARVSGPLSARAVQIEVAGDFPSERGRSGSEVPRAQQVRAVRDLVLWLHAVLLPQPLRHIYAHRQFTTSGIGHYNCPGPHLWRSVGVWACAELGLTSDRVGAGRPIPPEWESDDFLVR
jgi:hypothetical protein